MIPLPDVVLNEVKATVCPLHAEVGVATAKPFAGVPEHGRVGVHLKINPLGTVAVLIIGIEEVFKVPAVLVPQDPLAVVLLLKSVFVFPLKPTSAVLEVVVKVTAPYCTSTTLLVSYKWIWTKGISTKVQAMSSKRSRDQRQNKTQNSKLFPNP